MDYKEILEECKEFVDGFVEIIHDPNDENAVMNYFMNSQDDVRKITSDIRNVINVVSEDESISMEKTDEYITEANELLSRIQTAIEDYQKTLVVSPETEEDKAVSTFLPFNNDRLYDFISYDDPYKYLLFANGDLHYINSSDRYDTNKQITNILKEYENLDSYQLYEVNIAPVELHKETVYSI